MQPACAAFYSSISDTIPNCMRLRIAVIEEAVSPLLEASDAVARQAILPSEQAQALDELTGGWDLVGEQDGMRILVARKARLELRLGQLLVRPPTLEDAQLKSLLSTGLTSSQSIHLVADERGSSLAGWPIRVLHGRVLTRSVWAGGDTEHRLVAGYRFFGHCGDALLRVGSESLLQAARGELFDLLRSGWPQFTPPMGVAALSELWQ